MRWAVILCLAALCAFQPTSALAQDDETAGRADLARRLLDATARDVMQKSMIDAIERHAATLEGLTDEQRDWCTANALPILEPHLEAMLDQMETQYAELFTEAELTRLVSLYETPEGRVIAEKQATIGVSMGEQMQPMAAAYVTDLLGKFCARFDCSSGGGGEAAFKPN